MVALARGSLLEISWVTNRLHFKPCMGSAGTKGSTVVEGKPGFEAHILVVGQLRI